MNVFFFSDHAISLKGNISEAIYDRHLIFEANERGRWSVDLVTLGMTFDLIRFKSIYIDFIMFFQHLINLGGQKFQYGSGQLHLTQVTLTLTIGLI